MSSDPSRWPWAGAAILLWLGVVAFTVWRRRRANQLVSARLKSVSDEEAVLVVFASQTGFGEALAAMTASALREGGVTAGVLSMADLDLEFLRERRRALFVVSTTGEGDPPDAAARFVRKSMADAAQLEGLAFGILALGDRSYDSFCGFGHALDAWLRRSGALPLFDVVEVDNGDADAINHWRRQLSQATGVAETADWTTPAYQTWRLSHRSLANPGSPGGEAYHLAFDPLGPVPIWTAGDIAEIELPGIDSSPGGSREYSISSLPADGRIELLVRLVRHADGHTGRASGWLTQTLNIGSELGLKVRSNRSFHPAPDDAPIILIGNGTGIAGLRAHLKTRSDGSAGAWLLFGERSRAHDALFNEELEAWAAGGVLHRLDRCYSRDQGDGRYVQDLIASSAAELRAWVARGAYIYVCGSLSGMAPSVHAALEEALGVEPLVDLLETSRYRRDVY